MTVPIFSPSSREFLQNPYPHYSEIRSQNPVHWIDENTLVLAKYSDVRRALIAPELGVTAIPDLVESLAQRHKDVNASKLIEFARKSMVFTEGEDHRRLKKAVQSSFTEAQAARQKLAITECVDRILHVLPENEDIDLVPNVAHKLSGLFLGRMFGLDDVEALEMEVYTNRIRSLLQPRSATVNQLKSAVNALEEALTVFSNVSRRFVKSPFMEMYLSAMENGSVTEEEVLMLCIMTYVAGHETSQALAANALVSIAIAAPRLYTQPLNRSQARLVVHETLRYEPPLQITTRIVKRELSFDGHVLRPGQTLLLLLGSANRDEREFERPDEFDVSRNQQPYLTFGAGIHSCLGSHFAILEAEILLSRMLTEFRINLCDGALKRIWRPSSAFLRSAFSLKAKLSRELT